MLNRDGERIHCSLVEAEAKLPLIRVHRVLQYIIASAIKHPKAAIPAKAGHEVTRSEASALTISAIQENTLDAGSSPA
ncbi:MAG: hypothetical protein QME06_01375 [Desulfobacterales bacterium]|nr:hypothetical protein [Desulfobacterales bacterium]